MAQLSKQEIRDKYDSFSKWYDLMEIVNSLIIGRYRRKLLNGVSGNILEIGIGTGANLKHYPKNCNITGVDMSKGMLKRARAKADKLGMKIKLLQGDSEKLSFKPKSFDYVIDTLGMCTYPNPSKVFLEMKRVCKRKGKILLLEHGCSTNHFFQKILEKREKKHYSTLGCSLLRNYTMIMKKVGFKKYKLERKIFGSLWLVEIENNA